MLRTAIEIGSRVGGALAGLRKLEDRQIRLGRTLEKTRRQAAALPAGPSSCAARLIPGLLPGESRGRAARPRRRAA